MKRLSHLSALLLVQLLAGCSRCGKGAPAPASASIHRFLPRVAEVVVVLPDLRRLGGKLKQLQGLKLASFVAQLQGFPTAEAYVGGAMEQLGVDLRSADELARAGIDAGRGAAVAIVSAHRGYSVIAIADLPRFREAVRRLAASRLGATEQTTREELGHAITYFARQGESGAALALLPVGGFVLVATNDSVQELAGYASLSLPESLADAQPLSTALRHLPAAPDVYLHVPTTSSLAGRGGLANGTFSAELTPDALHLRADLPSGRTAQWLALLQAKGGEELIGSLPADAFLVGRFSGDPLALSQVWPALVGSQPAASIEGAGLDVARDVLPNLEPGLEAAVSIAPTATVSEMPAFDVRRTNPFRYFHLVALAAVKDSRKADQTLEKLAAIAPRLGAKVERAQRQGRNVFLTSYPLGQGAHFAQVNGKIAVAAPLDRLDQAIARLAKPADGNAGPLADGELRKVLRARPMAVVLDFPALSQSIRKLPSSAWGIGGFAIKATTVRWLDALDDLRAVTAGAYAAEGALQVEVDLRFVKR